MAVRFSKKPIKYSNATFGATVSFSIAIIIIIMHILLFFKGTERGMAAIIMAAVICAVSLILSGAAFTFCQTKWDLKPPMLFMICGGVLFICNLGNICIASITLIADYGDSYETQFLIFISSFYLLSPYILTLRIILKKGSKYQVGQASSTQQLENQEEPQPAPVEPVILPTAEGHEPPQPPAAPQGPPAAAAAAAAPHPSAAPPYPQPAPEPYPPPYVSPAIETTQVSTGTTGASQTEQFPPSNLQVPAEPQYVAAPEPQLVQVQPVQYAQPVQVHYVEPVQVQPVQYVQQYQVQPQYVRRSNGAMGEPMDDEDKSRSTPISRVNKFIPDDAEGSDLSDENNDDSKDRRQRRRGHRSRQFFKSSFVSMKSRHWLKKQNDKLSDKGSNRPSESQNSRIG